MQADKTDRSCREQRGIFGPHPDANRMALIRHHHEHIIDGTPFEQPVYCSIAGSATRTTTFTPRRFNKDYSFSLEL